MLSDVALSSSDYWSAALAFPITQPRFNFRAWLSNAHSQCLLVLVSFNVNHLQTFLLALCRFDACTQISHNTFSVSFSRRQLFVEQEIWNERSLETENFNKETGWNGSIAYMHTLCNNNNSQIFHTMTVTQ